MTAVSGGGANTPPLREVIAQALWESDDTATQSRWGFVDNKARGQYRHQADTVIAALGLTQVFTWSWPEHLTFDGKPGYGYHVDTAEEAAAEADLSYMTVVSRWQSAWTPTVPAVPCNPGDTP